MALRIITLIAMYAVVLGANRQEWEKSSVRDRTVCAMLLGPIAYLSILYVTHWNWPNLNDLFNAVFAEPAKKIVESVKLPS